jgi:hypothetical protein
MPRIPVYQSNVGSTTIPSQSLQTGTPAISPDTFGASSARANQYISGLIEKTGKAGADVINRQITEQEKYDRTLARQYEMETIDWARESYREETDNYKLGAAKDDGEGKSVYDRMNDKFRDYYQEKTKGMTKQQLAYYQPGYDNARQIYMSKSDAYVAQQVEEFDKGEKVNQIRHREDLALDVRDDDEEIAMIQAENEADIKSLYKGASPALIQEQVQNSNDRIHNGIIASYLRDNTHDSLVQAWKYFKENSVEMSAKVREATQTALETASLNEYAETSADKLELEYDHYEALEKAKKLSNPNTNDDDLQKMVTSILKSRKAERDQKKRETEDKKFDAAVDFILDAKGATLEEKFRVSEKYINDNFQGKDRYNLLSRIGTLYRGSGTKQDNLEEYQKMVDLMNNNRPAFLKMNINREKGHYFSPGTLKSFIKTQGEWRSGTESYSIDSRITASAREIGAEMVAKKPETVKQFRVYKDAIDSRINDYKQSTGKNPSIEEINKIIKEEQINYKLRGIKGGELSGSYRRGISFGYGPDVDIEKALADPLGLPDVKDDFLKEELKKQLEDDGTYMVNDTTIRILARLKLGAQYTPELKELANQYRIK